MVSHSQPPSVAGGAPRHAKTRLAKITHKELAKLREKAAAHDHYLAATEIMRQRQTEMLAERSSGADFYREDGWLACLREFSEAVVTAQAQDMDELALRAGAAQWPAWSEDAPLG